jgi:hypothetical protein
VNGKRIAPSASRDARERQHGVVKPAVVATVVLSLGLASGCGGGDDSTAPGASRQVSEKPRFESAASTNPRFRNLGISACRTDVGHDLGVRNVSCERARELALSFHNPFGHNYGRTRSLVYRSTDPELSDWTCSARLEQRTRTIRHVCWADGQVLRFKAG